MTNAKAQDIRARPRRAEEIRGKAMSNEYKTYVFSIPIDASVNEDEPGGYRIGAVSPYRYSVVAASLEEALADFHERMQRALTPYAE